MSARDDSAKTLHSSIRERQEALGERLAQLVDLYLEESDPKTWPAGKTVQGRGDRFWCKKNAEATGRLAMRTLYLLKPEIIAGAVLAGEDREEAETRIAREAKELERQGVALLASHKRKRNAR